MKKAFSLIELMIVIIILGLLVAIVLPNLTAKSDEAKDKLVCIQMKNISQALKMYKVDTSSYPTIEQGLNILMKKNYFEDNNMPKDAWNNDFIYIFDEQSNKYDLISKGQDKKESTKDDIYYSSCYKK